MNRADRNKPSIYSEFFVSQLKKIHVIKNWATYGRDLGSKVRFLLKNIVEVSAINWFFLEDVKADETLKIVSYEKNKKKYDRVQDTVLKMEAGHVTFNLDNVFDGNKELSDQINQVMNENWKSVFDELKDGYNDAIKRFTDNIVNRFFAKIADNDIFLD